LVVLIFFILGTLAGCINRYKKQKARPEEYYDQFKNPDLSYYWNFNKSFEFGGKTWNRNYFELKDYPWWREAELFFDFGVLYELQYKHEEGHIWHNQLLGFDTLEEFNKTKLKELEKNGVVDGDFYSYLLNTTEGIADYYLWDFFKHTYSGNFDSKRALERYFLFIRSSKEKKKGSTLFRFQFCK